jgi:dynein heavy chain
MANLQRVLGGTAGLQHKQQLVTSCSAPCLAQEVERWNSVVAVMRSSLADLQRALSGEVGFSAALEALAASLFNGQLPAMWARLNPATEKPLAAWMTWFQRRHRQYMDWVENGEPAVVWLAGLHTPETYLAALVQARHPRLAI